MTWLVISLAAAYALVVVLLVLILLSGGVPAALRGAAVAITLPLIFFTYRNIGELRGVPSDDALPEHFQLHWARVVEPNKLTGDAGAIFLWVECLDAQNYASGTPRAFRIPYSSEMADTLRKASAQIAQGEPIAGELVDELEGLDTADRLTEEIANAERPQNAVVGERVHVPDLGDISFGSLPAPVTPEKPQQ